MTRWSVHLSDLTEIRTDIRNRDVYVALHEADLDSFHEINFGHFRNNTIRFLVQHPKCRLGIRDEYGREHPIEEDDE